MTQIFVHQDSDSHGISRMLINRCKSDAWIVRAAIWSCKIDWDRASQIGPALNIIEKCVGLSNLAVNQVYHARIFVALFRFLKKITNRSKLGRKHNGMLQHSFGGSNFCFFAALSYSCLGLNVQLTLPTKEGGNKGVSDQCAPSPHTKHALVSFYRKIFLSIENPVLTSLVCQNNLNQSTLQ